MKTVLMFILVLTTMTSCGYLQEINTQMTQLRCNGAFDMKACTEGK
jgi:hypothetical protein